MRNTILSAGLLLSALSGMAQDYHISQYDGSPLYLNPALTGMYIGEPVDYRINSGYRTQWRSLGGKPFVSTWLGYDMALPKKFGAGAILMNNRSGTGHFNHLTFNLSGAYHISEMSAPHHLTVGLQVGIFQKRFDGGLYTFDSQYTDGGFDPNIASGEVFDRSSKTNVDVHGGMYYRFRNENRKVSPFIGLSVFHAPRPNESFTNDKNRLPMRWVLNAGSEFKVGEKIRLTPMALFMQQANAREINTGLRGTYQINENYNILIGADYRIKDAFIYHIGLGYNGHMVRFSYDMNTSYLKEYSSGRGGVEFSILLNMAKGRKLNEAPPKI